MNIKKILCIHYFFYCFNLHCITTKTYFYVPIECCHKFLVIDSDFYSLQKETYLLFPEFSVTSKLIN